MHNFKKLAIVFMAATMMLTSAVSAFAAGSPTLDRNKGNAGGTKVTPVVSQRSNANGSNSTVLSNTFAIEPLGSNSHRTDSWTEHVPAADQNAINQGTVDGFVQALGASTTPGKDAVINALNGKVFFTKFFDCYPFGNTPKQNATVKMEVPGIGSYSKNDIAVIHFSEAEQKWEVLDFTMDGGDVISVKYNTFSPTVIAVTDNGQTVTPVIPTVISTAAPKTGVDSVWATYAIIAAALAAAAVVVRVTGKKTR